MHKRVAGFLGLFVLVAAAVTLTSHAQNPNAKPTSYTYVAQWHVARAQWPDARKVFDADASTLDKLVNDGTLTGYGIFENIIHSEESSTHGVWFTAASMAGILKSLDVIAAQPPVPGDAVLSSSKHWDEILESDIYGAHSGTFKGAYLEGSDYQVKPGHGREFRELVKSTIVPVLDKLLADGLIHDYSVDSQSYHSSKPGSVAIVSTPVDAAAVDKSDAAFEAALGKNEALGAAIRNLTELSEHRDFLLRVTAMRNK